MNINANLNENAMADVNQLPWSLSPQNGVKRKMIERDGEEVARATTIVSFDEESYFPEHAHAKGEEFFVLDGVFSDETGDFGKGMYVRNPAGTRHAPFTKEGCQILVKLRQMNDDDQKSVRVDTNKGEWLKINDLEYLLLHQFASENVAMIRADKNTLFWDSVFPKGLEFYVLEGDLVEGDIALKAGHWRRIAPGNSHNLRSITHSLLFVKTGHLSEVDENSSPLLWTEFLGSAR